MATTAKTRKMAATACGMPPTACGMASAAVAAAVLRDRTPRHKNERSDNQGKTSKPERQARPRWAFHVRTLSANRGDVSDSTTLDAAATSRVAARTPGSDGPRGSPGRWETCGCRPCQRAKQASASNSGSKLPHSTCVFVTRGKAETDQIYSRGDSVPASRADRD